MSGVVVSSGSAGVGSDTLRLLAVIADGGRPDGSAEQFIALCSAVDSGLVDVSVSRAGLVALLGARVTGSVDARDVEAALSLLDVPALRVLAAIRVATRDDGGWSRGVSGLARELGLGVSAVRSALHDVLDVGLVVERTPHGRSGVGAGRRTLYVSRMDSVDLLSVSHA
ncbi:hypothetical protein ACLUWO_08180 [Pseudoscardovia radai]|uniref:hypothetical protein n=1 Tax=Pseudoscardovia radai TaxID=987066 RepID=UPI003994063F